MDNLSEKPPQHAFEVRIAIGANDWPYVVRTMNSLALHLVEHGPACSLVSGGGGGAHSVHIERRDITPDDFDRELELWAQRLSTPAPGR